MVVLGRAALDVVVVGALVAVVLVVAVLAGVAVVDAAALGAVAYAAQMREDEKLRNWGAARDVEAVQRAEKPLRAGVAAILDRFDAFVQFRWITRTRTRSHDLDDAWTC